MKLNRGKRWYHSGPNPDNKIAPSEDDLRKRKELKEKLGRLFKLPTEPTRAEIEAVIKSINPEFPADKLKGLVGWVFYMRGNEKMLYEMFPPEGDDDSL